MIVGAHLWSPTRCEFVAVSLMSAFFCEHFRGRCTWIVDSRHTPERSGVCKPVALFMPTAAAATAAKAAAVAEMMPPLWLRVPVVFSLLLML